MPKVIKRRVRVLTEEKEKDIYDRKTEQPAVRTTIVGGRPPGLGKGVGAVPRGIEVLVKKAAVDPEFKALLLTERAAAAAEIGLELGETETAMLDGVPMAQLEAIIANTTVNSKLRPAFMGRAAAVMLAALGIGLVGCGDDDGTGPQVRGTRPDEPEVRESTESETDVSEEKFGSGEDGTGTEEGKRIEEMSASDADNENGRNDVTEKDKPVMTGITGTRPDRVFAGATGSRPDLPFEKSNKVKPEVTLSASTPESITGPGANDERRSALAVTSVVRRHLAGVLKSYISELKKNPAIGGGEIAVEFTIAADGYVIKAAVVGSTMNAPGLESRLVSLIYGWRFPIIEEGDVTVVDRFVFVNKNN